MPSGLVVLKRTRSAGKYSLSFTCMDGAKCTPVHGWVHWRGTQKGDSREAAKLYVKNVPLCSVWQEPQARPVCLDLCLPDDKLGEASWELAMHEHWGWALWKQVCRLCSGTFGGWTSSRNCIHFCGLIPSQHLHNRFPSKLRPSTAHCKAHPQAVNSSAFTKRWAASIFLSLGNCFCFPHGSRMVCSADDVSATSLHYLLWISRECNFDH